MQALLKYRGGKRREIKFFEKYFPEDFDVCIEPFFLWRSCIFLSFDKKYAVNIRNRFESEAEHLIITNCIT